MHHWRDHLSLQPTFSQWRIFEVSSCSTSETLIWHDSRDHFLLSLSLSIISWWWQSSITDKTARCLPTHWSNTWGSESWLTSAWLIVSYYNILRVIDGLYVKQHRKSFILQYILWLIIQLKCVMWYKAAELVELESWSNTISHGLFLNSVVGLDCVPGIRVWRISDWQYRHRVPPFWFLVLP